MTSIMLPAYSDYLGIPYDKANCAELVARYLGIEIPDHSHRSKLRKSYMIQEYLMSHTIPTITPEIGDIVLMRESERLYHVGVLVTNNYILHTNQRIGYSHIIRLDQLHIHGYILVSYRRLITNICQ